MERAMLRITLTDKKESHMDQRTNDVEITHNFEEGTVKQVRWMILKKSKLQLEKDLKKMER